MAALRERGKAAGCAPNAEAILDALVPQLRRSDVVAVFSNGKFDGIHDKLLARLRGLENDKPPVLYPAAAGS